jgi:4-hydroxybenzoyl-CoA thioesterase
MTYRRIIAVEFNHCDPAGIVFYPRYFEMVNSVVETFFGEALGYPFARMMAEAAGVPTRRLEADFPAPSRLGDRLEFSLRVLRVGGASADLAIAAECSGEVRIEVRSTLVWVREGKAASWPEAIRAGLVARTEASAP